MQLTVDIPEPLYRELEEDATTLATTIQQVAIRRLHARDTATHAAVPKGRRVSFPLIHATRPGTIDLTQNLNDAIFDDFNVD